MHRHLTRHLLACLVAALLLAVSPTAFATTLVPMCGERAETVAAPPPMRAATDASLTTPCTAPSELAIDPTAPSRAPEIAAELPAPARLPAVYYRLPRRPFDKQQAFDADHGGARSGFTRGLDRPPR